MVNWLPTPFAGRTGRIQDVQQTSWRGQKVLPGSADRFWAVSTVLPMPLFYIAASTSLTVHSSVKQRATHVGLSVGRECCYQLAGQDEWNCHASILPSTGHKNKINIGQPNADKNPISHFSLFKCCFVTWKGGLPWKFACCVLSW